MQQQPGASQFGVPPQSASDMPAFPSSSSGRVLGIQEHAPPMPPEAASPISSRLPASFDDLGPAMAVNFGEDEALAAAGEEGERGGTPGNRWPRQETLALLKIRQDMDAAFRDATLKGPLWDEVSRKLAELGYKRNAKKCKEKFENVHKYYKRTKEGRAGRQDGKSYRFFTELEALHTGAGGSSSSPTITPKITSTPTATTTPTTIIAASQSPISFPTPAMVGPSSGRTIQASPISAAVPQQLFSPQPIRPVTEFAPPIVTAAAAPTTTNTTPVGLQGFSAAAAAAGISFSSNSSASDSFESDEEGTEDATEASGQRPKRPREGSHLGSRKKMMVFFEGLMKQVVEKQEAMQQKFLETIEKREQDRMIREEAWRRQEVARLSREQELLAQERTLAANRDAALISYLQKLSSSQPIPVPTTPAPTIPTNPVVVMTSAAPTPPPPSPSQLQMLSTAVTVQPLQQQTPPPPPPQPIVTHHHQPQHESEQLQLQISPTSEHMSLSELHEGAASNRWPKAEVHALIKIRSGLDNRYQEAGPKGPLWEEISVEMHKLGYNRNSKRCKEKWENINKYYKKVKESNKKRPEDAKTCPYFHALDALYRQKQINAGSTSASSSSPVGISGAPERAEPLSVKAPLPLPSQIPPVEGQSKNGNDGNTNGGNSQGVQVQTSNGGLTPSFFEEGMKKPEDIMMELMKQRQQQSMIESYDNDGDSDTMDQDDQYDDDDDEDDDENSKLQYKIQFQRQNEGTNGGEGGNASTGNSAAMNAGSFLAIVQ